MSDCANLAPILLATGLEQSLRSGIPKLWHLAALRIPGVTLEIETKLYLPCTDTYPYFRENYQRKHYIDGDHSSLNSNEFRRRFRNAVRDQNEDAIKLLSKSWSENSNFSSMEIPYEIRKVILSSGDSVLTLGSSNYSMFKYLYLNGYREYLMATMNPADFTGKLAFLAGRANDEFFLAVMPKDQLTLNQAVAAGLARGGHFATFKASYMEFLSYPSVLKNIGRTSNLEFLTLFDQSDYRLTYVVENALEYGNLHLLRNLKSQVTAGRIPILKGGRPYIWDRIKVLNDDRTLFDLLMVRIAEDILDYFTIHTIRIGLESKGLTKVVNKMYAVLGRVQSPMNDTIIYCFSIPISISEVPQFRMTHSMIYDRPNFNHFIAPLTNQATGRVDRSYPFTKQGIKNQTRSGPSLRQLKSQNRRQQIQERRRR